MPDPTHDELWEKSNAAFGDFVPGIHSDMAYRKCAVCLNFLPHVLLHGARYAAIALLAIAIGIAEPYWVTWNNWHRHSDISDFPIMVPGGGANIVNGYMIRLPMHDTLVMPAGI